MDCSTRGDWRKAVQAYRLMVAKGIVPDTRTWRVLLRAVKIGEEGRVALVLLEEIEPAAQRAGTDGLVPVELYNCASRRRRRAAAGGARSRSSTACATCALKPNTQARTRRAHGGCRPGAVGATTRPMTRLQVHAGVPHTSPTRRRRPPRAAVELSRARVSAIL